ncbi:putative transposase [Scytonema sp. HK-05]|nr:putative transposase [Scytonema sp. HK-05]
MGACTFFFLVKVNPPKFKKKDNRQTARFRKGGFSIKNEKVYLAKIGYIKTKWSRPLPSEPSSVTVIKDRAGRYFLSFVVEIQPEFKPAQNQAVGIDLGLRTFAALSNGEKVSSPDYSCLERKIRRSQRKLSRRQKNSKRRERMRLKVARLKAKLRDIRKNFLHKLSTKVVNENQVIALEDLNVSGMVKNRCLSRAISTALDGENSGQCVKPNQTNSGASLLSLVDGNQPVKLVLIVATNGASLICLLERLSA